MKNKKGYTMGIYMTWLFVGIIIGVAIMYYIVSNGYLDIAPPVVPAP